MAAIWHGTETRICCDAGGALPMVARACRLVSLAIIFFFSSQVVMAMEPGFSLAHGEAGSYVSSQAVPYAVAARSTSWGKLVVKRRSKPTNLRVARAKPKTMLATVSKIVLEGTKTATSVSLFLSHPVSFEVFTLSDPYRVVIDMPQVNFALSATGHGHGLVKAYRYGLFAPGRSRIVVDANAPVMVRKTAQSSRPASPAGGRATVLRIDLERTDEIGFLLKPPPRRPVGRATAAVAAPLRSAAKRNTKRKNMARAVVEPVVVIDPGHGGIDPGAVGVSHVYEKQITMAVARRLAAILRRSKRYRVRMTRTSDRFVSLDDRVELSRKSGASLFISIHADAIANRAAAGSVRGATVYTLSERASDAQARALAIKENAVDALAGLQVRRGRQYRQVQTILIDLLKRETANFSTKFSNLLLLQFKGRIPLHGKAHKAAAFHVLKQTDTPSVLIELGYMSNRRDETMLKKAKWQMRIARAIAGAVDAYFGKRIAGTK